MYAQLNKTKKAIIGEFGPGLNLPHVSFSINTTDEEYAEHGLYKIIEDYPKLKSNEKYGDVIIQVDDDQMTVVRSREVEEKSDFELKAEQKTAQFAQKLAGVSLGGKMCSATRDDQNGLVAVALAIRAARDSGAKFPETQFEFENGAELIINDDNFDEYYASWVTFRQSFFKP